MAFKTPEASTSFLLLNETATEYKPKFPTGTKNGYLVLCSFLVFGTGRTYTATGWTQLGTAATITGGQYVSFYRVATKADEEGVGTTTYPIKISGAAISGTWATTWVKNVNATTPVVGGENKAAAASTTVKWPTATPSEVPVLDMLIVQGVAEDTFTLPSGFTALATGTSLFHSFSRTYETKAATGETSTTQTTSTPVGTTRILILGEEESGTTPAVITPSPTGGVGTAGVALSARSLIGLSASGVGTAGVSLNAPTKITPGVSAGVATAGLKLTAPTRITPSASAGVGVAVLALTAPTLLPLSPVAGVGSAALALEIPSSGVNLPLQPTGGAGAAVLGLTAAVKLALSSQGAGAALLAVTARPLLTLAASGEGSAAVKLNARALLTLLAAGQGSAAAALTAAITLPLAPIAGVATVGLVITTPGSAAIIPSSTGGAGSASLALTAAARLGSLLAPGVGSAAASLRAIPQIVAHSEGTATAALSLKVTPRLTLISAGEGQASLVVSTKVFLALMASGEGQAMLALSVLAVVGYGTAVLSATPLGSAGLIITAADGDAAALPLGSAAVGSARLGSAILAGGRGSATLVVKP